ncbi:unnamed protein product [Ixodes persulcatus]
MELTKFPTDAAVAVRSSAADGSERSRIQPVIPSWPLVRDTAENPASAALKLKW